MNWLELPFGGSRPWVETGIECMLAVLLGWAACTLLLRMLGRVSADLALARTLLAFSRRPLQILLPLLMLQLALGDAPESLFLIHPLRHLLTIALLATLTYFCIRLVAGGAEAMEARFPADVADNLRARSVHTQTKMLSRTLMMLIGVLGAASILMTFPDIRHIGASLLASAGVAGLVAGVAARPVLGNLIAGLQIALTQPLRINDVLIVEGEWGTVEQITGSYVVVHIWDDRRLIVPLEWFIQHPFQNWTQSSSQLIGAVFLWVDYKMPLAPLRQELESVCRATSQWDGRVCLLQVTDTSERAIQLRALVSAGDASKAWNLRCTVREALVRFIQNHYPDCLPRQRYSFDPIDHPVLPKTEHPA